MKKVLSSKKLLASSTMDLFMFLAPTAAAMAGQAIMMAAMLAARQYLYLAFLLPGLISSIALTIVVIIRWRLQTHGQTQNYQENTDNLPSTSFSRKTATALPAPDACLNPMDYIRPQELGHYLAAEKFSSLYPHGTGWKSIVSQWLKPKKGETLQIPIGYTLHTEVTQHSPHPTESAQPSLQERSPTFIPRIYTLDLLSQGPHALIGGTTGSGKSVFLETWCLSMACTYPPERLLFVFLDFKGGATFRQLQKIPHCVGSVSDLNLAHALRALLSLEREIKRRESLVHSYGVDNINRLPHPPAHLLVVIDEFHAIKELLPDYIPRLVSVAALGRSLGIHLIACTQNPLGQVNGDMKANLSLHICLRVRDSLQSLELLDAPFAALLHPGDQGIGFLHDGAQCLPFRAAQCTHPDQLITSVQTAYAFICAAGKNTGKNAGKGGSEPDQPVLFSPPLPEILAAPTKKSGKTLPIGTKRNRIYMGLRDDGITTSDWFLDLEGQNIAIVAPHGYGKTETLKIICQAYERLRDPCPTTLSSDEPVQPHESLPVENTRSIAARLAICDNCDPYLDPLAAYSAGFPADAPSDNSFAEQNAQDKENVLVLSSRHQFQTALTDRKITVFYTVSDPRNVRYPENCDAKIIFPTLDRTTDLLWGLPTDLLNDASFSGRRIPGRGIYCGPESYIFQTYAPSFDT